MKKAESQLHDFCDRVKKNLNVLSLKDKRCALDVLDIQVIVWNDRVVNRRPSAIMKALPYPSQRCTAF